MRLGKIIKSGNKLLSASTIQFSSFNDKTLALYRLMGSLVGYKGNTVRYCKIYSKQASNL